MEIKIASQIANRTDIEALDDHKKVFLAVVSALYRTMDLNTYAFFHSQDLTIMTGLQRFDPTQYFAQNSKYGEDNSWFYDCFDYQFHDYYNLGIKPKTSPQFRFNHFGKPSHATKITSKDAQRMFLYLMGRFTGEIMHSPFSMRNQELGYNAFTLDRDLLGYFNHKYAKKEFYLHDEGPMD